MTIDISTATASTTTINGTLSYARSGDNEFTMVGGSMSVNAGGTLDMGTQSSPILQGTTAYLILSSGTYAGQYGLVINPGGNFTVYGAAKTPWSFYTGGSDITSGTSNITVASAAGWQPVDTLTIDADTVTINGAVSGNSVPITNPAMTHSAAAAIVVANLTHNVVVRSSGTAVPAYGGSSTGENSAYIENLVTNTTSFNVNYGDFQYLGANQQGQFGVDFESAKGSISSSTFRYGYDGIYFSGSSNNNALSSNVAYDNNFAGMHLDNNSNNNTLASNAAYNNVWSGLNVSGTENTLISNVAFDNGDGVHLLTSNTLLALNMFYGNSNSGIHLDNDVNNTLISNSVYNNDPYGVQTSISAGDVLANCNIGYTSATVLSPDNSAEIFYDNANIESLFLKNSLLNPSPGIYLTGFAKAGSYLVNYSTNSGIVQVYGDYQLSGSTLTLDYSGATLHLQRHDARRDDRLEPLRDVCGAY